MKIEKIKARPVSYGARRSLSSVRGVVIHYSGNEGDTAHANGVYFRDSNTRSAGAHYFISQNGDIVESIPMDLVAWSVGGDHRSGKPGEAAFYGVLTNNNTVSIELCDNESKPPSDAQTKATRELIAYIRKNCVNANTIARHWDVNGKSCPGPYLLNAANWKKFISKVAPTMSSTSGGSSGAKSNKTIKTGQANANKFLHNHLPSIASISEDGIRGSQTKKHCARVLQEAANLDYNARLVVDGIIGNKSKAALNGKVIKKGDKKYMCLAAKILYQCNGKDASLKYSKTYGGGLAKVAGKDTIKVIDLIDLL